MSRKKEIRHTIKQKRTNFSRELVQEKSSQITSKISALAVFKTATIICVYSSIGNEVDTADLVKIALKNNKQVAYPRTNTENNTMEFYTVKNPKDLKRVQSGSFSLLEPDTDPAAKVSPDKNTLMIVPGLAFDHQFYRVGYGGGFYDRYLTLHTSLTTIGVCFDFQLISNAHPNQYDQPVDSIMTPTRYLY